MLKNMKIGSRLGFGFGVIMALLVIVGIFSIMEITQLNGMVNSMVNDLFPKTVQANDIIDNQNIIARSLRNIVIDTGKTTADAELKRIAESRKIISERLETLKKPFNQKKAKNSLPSLTPHAPSTSNIRINTLNW